MIWAFGLFVQKREDYIQLGFIGFGKMGGNITQRPLKGGSMKSLKEDQDLKQIKAWVEDSGESCWTVFETIDLNISAPVITQAFQRRLRSHEEDPFADKLLAAMRKAFGGRAIKEG